MPANNSAPEATGYHIADWLFDPGRGQLSRSDDTNQLQPAAVNVLLNLAQRAGQIVSRQELGAGVDPDKPVSEKRVAAIISNLRKVFGDDPRKPRIIKTHPGRGYSLIAKVSRPTHGPAQARPAIPTPSTDSTAALPKTTAAIPDTARWRYWLMASMVLIALAMVAVLWRPQDKTRETTDPHDFSDEPAIIVLPFTHNNDGKPNALSNGISDELIGALSRIPQLVVIDQHTALRLSSNQRKEIIARELGTRYVVQGKLRRNEKEVNIAVSLFDARENMTIPIEALSVPYSDIASAPARISERVRLVLGLRSEFPASAAASIRTKQSIYVEYLTGLSHFRKKDSSNTQTALKHFTRVTQQDPAFQRPWIYLALAWLRLAVYEIDHRFAEALLNAQAALREVASPDEHAGALYAQAFIALFQNEHRNALDILHRALTLRPSYADAYVLLAWTLHYMNKPQAALANLDRANRINPQASVLQRLVQAEINLAQNRPHDAVRNLRKAQTMDADQRRVQLLLIATLANTNRLDEARKIATTFTGQPPAGAKPDLRPLFPAQDPAMLDAVMTGLQRAGIAVQHR